ncbi:contactin-associated protein-like 4 isoform X1 [Clavelina lepadiformis]|uniref:contactin-associated protein-like 4 isoform X1 n=1 Tax=Clavelina lepadiformis TaxID=159417 RepID=UPI004043147F
MNQIIFILLCFVAIWCVRCQLTDSENNCPGYTIQNYILGPDGYTMQPRVNDGNPIQQSRPGKIGPRGVQGVKGEKGSKGEPSGTPNNLVLELQMLKRKMQKINNDQQMLKMEVDEIKTLLDQNRSSLSVDQSKSKNNQVNPSDSNTSDNIFTCDDIDGDENDSGTRLISPDPGNVEPFNVRCDFTGTTETVIEHDTMGEIEITTKCGPRKCYKRPVRYDVSMQQIVALINRSSQCRQFIKYRCKGNRIFSGNHYEATWLSRDGTQMHYWGGATSRRVGYCACGETGTCRHSNRGSNYKCNCDNLDNDISSDEGYLTDKDTLPVTGMQFGDLDSSHEAGWHTLGPLRCTGRNHN